MKKPLYPGVEEAERQRKVEVEVEEQPDMIGLSPNYEKFDGWTPEAVLVFLNID